MPPAAHLVSGRVPGCGPLDVICLPFLGVSGRAFNVSPCSSLGDFKSFQQGKVVTLRCTSRGIMSTICNAYPNGQRRNEFSRQNSRGVSNNKNWHDKDLDIDSLEDSERPFLKNGSRLLHDSSSPDKSRLLELFNEIKEKLVQGKALKEAKKANGSVEPAGDVVADSQRTNEWKEGYEQLLEAMQNMTVQQGKENSSSSSSSSSGSSDRTPFSFYTPKEGINGVQHKEVPSVSRQATDSLGWSPVRKRKSYDNLDPLESSGFTEIDRRRRANKTELEYTPAPFDDLEMDESDSEDELEVEDEQFLENETVFDEMLGDAITSEIEESGVEGDDDSKEKDVMEDNELNGMKIADLKALAKSRGMKGYSKLKKHELVELLTSSAA